MRKISAKVAKQLENNPRMKLCPLRHNPLAGTCRGRIQWHHVWIYAGQQIDEPWAIVSPCEGHHDAVKSDPYVKSLLERESLLLATPEDLAKYPRKNWAQIKKQLDLL